MHPDPPNPAEPAHPAHPEPAHPKPPHAANPHPGPARALFALYAEYEDHLSHQDLSFMVRQTLTHIREPDAATLDIFLDELAGGSGQHPDPSAAEGDPEARRTTERRRQLTWAWRRAIDALVASL